MNGRIFVSDVMICADDLATSSETQQKQEQEQEQ
jgi:hypothetical protein